MATVPAPTQTFNDLASVASLQPSELSAPPAYVKPFLKAVDSSDEAAIERGGLSERLGAPVVATPPRVLPTIYGEQPVEEAERMIALQSWEGVVLDVGETTFTARLADATADHAEEQVELSTEELSDFDLALLEPGAIFYWTIGYRLLRGSRERVSRIRFRRLPAWNRRQLHEARERAGALRRDLGW